MTTILASLEVGMISYALWYIYHHDKSLTNEERQAIKDLYNKLHGRTPHNEQHRRLKAICRDLL